MKHEFDYPAVQKAYDLSKELFQRVGKFPKTYKYTIGNRIIETSLVMMAIQT